MHEILLFKCTVRNINAVTECSWKIIYTTYPIILYKSSVETSQRVLRCPGVIINKTNMDTKVLSLIYTLGSYCGSNPWTKFGKIVLRPKKIAVVVYMIYLSILLHDLIISITYEASKFDEPVQMASLEILNALKMFVTVSYPLGNLLANIFFKRKLWNAYFRKSHQVIQAFRVTLREVTTDSHKMVILVTSIHVYFFGMILIEFYLTYLREEGDHSWYLFTFYNLYEMYNTIITTLVQTVLAVLTHQYYKGLNTFLQRSAIRKATGIQRVIILNETRYMLRTYRLLYELVQIHNRLFGWSMVFYFGFVMISLLQISSIAVFFQRLELDVSAMTDLLHGPILLVI